MNTWGKKGRGMGREGREREKRERGKGGRKNEFDDYFYSE